jgi:hypothetical protein
MDTIKTYYDNLNLKETGNNIVNSVKGFVNNKTNDINASKFANDKGLNTTVIILLLSLVIFAILSIYYILAPNNDKTNKSSSALNSSGFGYSILFLLLLFGIIIILYKKFIKGDNTQPVQSPSSGTQSFSSLLYDFKAIIGVVLYTIFIIYFFRLMFTDKSFLSPDFVKKYGFYITPITILFTAFVFYQGFKSNYESQFNITYERIKMMILLFCFISIMIVYNSVAPGDFIEKYYGYSLALTLLIAIFAFLYLIILLVIPNETVKSVSETPLNLLSYFNKYTNILTISFIIFLIFSTIGISVKIGNESKNIDNEKISDNEKKVKKDEILGSYWYIILFLLLTSILWIILIFWSKSEKGFDDNLMNITNVNQYYKIILGVFGVIISGCVIAWLVYNIQSLMGSGDTGTTITRFILNLILVLVILTLVYKVIVVEMPYYGIRSNSFVTLIIDLLLYIPCIFSNIFDFGMGNLVSDYNSATTGTFTLIISMILILIAIFILPKFEDKIILQGGKLLINEPVNTRNQKIVATYEDLNGSESGFDYNYSISFWTFLDSMPPSTNESYDKYTSLLNYGGKPDILYNPSLNTLIITMKLKNIDPTKYETLDIKTTNYDDNYLIDKQSIVIVHKIENVLLQKWNQFIINCEGGVIDVFYNGKLIKSSIDMVPYMSLDNLTVGQENGVYGGLCNLVYYKNPLNVNQIYYSYNTVKSSNPPITNNNNKTLLEK